MTPDAPRTSQSSHSSRGSHGPAGRHGGDRPRKPRRQYVRKRKVCRFCVDKIDYVDYKNADLLRTFILDRGKVIPRRITGTCSRHQRWLKLAVKRARNIALLPFAAHA
ncbi:MAG TPA: 30S ribosomal protein S18 [Patescibacteria group bacterium]|nr:30S ribosomal protein S18 [Patescibacteria group bacterium]